MTWYCVVVSTYKTSVRIVGLLAISSLIPLNLFLAHKDGTFTDGVRDYSVQALSEERDFEDHPMQTIFTYISRDATFLNPGTGNVVLPFKDRLGMYFGDDLGDREIFDVRDTFSDEELAGLRRDVDSGAFPDEIPCPHNLELKCSLLTDWNKSRAKNAAATLVVLRYGELEYAIVDSEKVGFGPE